MAIKTDELRVNLCTLSQATAGENDLTPSVSGIGVLITNNNTTVREITDFDNGVAGQELIVVINDAYTKLIHNANIKLANGYDLTCAAGQVFRFMKVGTEWWEQRSSKESVATAYASIYVVDAAAAQTPDQNVPTKVTGFTTNGTADNMTADAANDKIIVTQTGLYHVGFQVSFSGDGVSTVKWNVHTGSPLASTYIQCTRKLGTVGDVGSASGMGIISLTAGHDVELWVTSDDATPSITPQDMSLDCHRVD